MQKFSIEQAKVFSLEETKFKESLSGSSRNFNSKKTLYFPNAFGEIMAFDVVESPIFAPELAMKYPQIKSYQGIGVTDPSKKICFSISHKGLQSMIIDADAIVATFMHKTQDGNYILYLRKPDHVIGDGFICETKDAILKSKLVSLRGLVDSEILRKYRVAISTTGEYTQYHGGTKADALAAINATLTRVNMIFENDLAVTLELVANTDLVIYTNPTTDPYSGNLNVEAQSTFNSVIGAANYDLGHLFDNKANDGNAGFVGSVCVDAKKGSAYVSGSTPEGDLFDIDYVAHEMGHQFGANHTWSFESEGTLVQVEPGSGSTIMGYAGIVGDNNVASSAQDYFHYNSIKQIIAYIENTGCATEIPIANTAPVNTAISDYTIPKGTAFVLKGNATDDLSNVLTFTWEQIDDGVVTNTSFGPNNLSGANFRSQKPTTQPDRYFPKLSSIVQGNLTQTNPTVNSPWETVSNVEREMNFALTVRDNAPGGGQVACDEVKVNVINTSGPFVVRSQDTNLTYVGGSIQEVIWDVANTNMTPINAQKVAIWMSLDGGLSFPFLVADDVINDGSHPVLIPGEVSNQARFMIKAVDNIFLAVNASNFTISASEVVLNFARLDFDVCQPSDLIVPFVYETDLLFSETSTFSISGLPAGLSAIFSQTTATANNTPVTLTFSNTGEVATGIYPITITATSLSVTKSISIELAVYDTSLNTVNLTSPANGVLNGELSQLFEWNEDPLSTSYDIEIATDIGFSAIVESATVLFNSYKTEGLLPETVYFWRVKPKNSCGEGVYSTVFSFKTKEVNCTPVEGTGFPISISSSGTSTIFSTIAFDQMLSLVDVKVALNVTHTYVGDLTIKLTSPEGTTVVLVSNSCGDKRNINATFGADASSFICNDNPAIFGLVKPLGALSSFIGESSLGNWTLQIDDNARGDGGSINSFGLEFCGVKPDFSIAIVNESCAESGDGAIEIKALLPIEYTATITGNGTSITDHFTDTYVLDNLTAGTYEIRIAIDGGSTAIASYFRDIVVIAPEEVMVDASVMFDSAMVALNLSGSDAYIIDLNGTIIATTDQQITLALEQGENQLRVSTNFACQGVYEETIIFGQAPFVFPNPVQDKLNIYYRAQNFKGTVSIYAMNGRLIKQLQFNTSEPLLEVDLSELGAQTYIVRMAGRAAKETFKIIKN